MAGTTNSWRVFRSLSSGATTGPNKVSNPGMETTGANLPLAGWSSYGSGYLATTTNAHGGVRSLQCSAVAAGEVHGASQMIVLNQTTPKVLKLSGWSKAQSVSGVPDSDYSVYLDIIYTNGTPLWGQTINFSTGTHDWEYKEAFIMPALPIQHLYCYALFRNSHTGTVWFDDLSVKEVQDAVVQFDGAPVIASAPSPLPYDAASRFTLLSGDGLQVKVAQDGGVIAAVTDGTNNLRGAAEDYASGWFVCDRGAGSDWWNVGGWVSNSNGVLLQQGVITNLNLSAEIRYSTTNDAIRIQATVANLTAADRAISLYFALPLTMDSGYWWHSPRDRVAITQSVESATLADLELGARNQVSAYPVATVANSSALTLAVPPDRYRPFRMIYNGATRQFFAVFDVGLSATPMNFPQIATAELWLYRSDAAWGLRSGLEGFYRRFPAAFTRAFTNEGIWVAFADIRGITNVSDFGIRYHEIGYNTAFVKSDDTNGIGSFRYVSEPWSYWMNMPTNLSNTDYNSVHDYLLQQHSQSVKAATATLSSGARDPNGLLSFFPAAAPWCSYGAAFYVNASPGISNPPYTVTKFSIEWNSTVRDVYNHPGNGVLDGEYIDSFGAAATVADHSSNHLRTTTFPPTFTRDNSTLMTPLIFGTYEMARAIGADVHALGKPIIANTVFAPWPRLPLGIGLFDFAGTEINCFDAAGSFVPPSDDSLLYARALSGVRPYGYLLNTDFTKVSSAEMEDYMRLCAVYAIYPSAFSADASSNNYFEQPANYERDRLLFKKYVPIIRAMSLAGWRAVTDATVDNATVGIEAFGTNAAAGRAYLTVRNSSPQAVTATITFDTNRWTFPNSQSLRLTNLFDGGTVTINLAAGSNSFTLTLPAQQCNAYAVRVIPPPPPLILRNDPGFGFNSNQFGFNTSAAPGLTGVIEASTNLLNWLPLKTNAVPESGMVPFSDVGAALLARRFYRLRLQ